MIKLNYKATRTFTGAEIAHLLNDTGLDDVTFKVISFRPAGWDDKLKKLAEKRSTDIAYQIVGEALISISQDGEEWPIGDPERAKDLRDSIEAQVEGHGDEFIINLAWAIVVKQREAEQERLKNSLAPLQVSANGNGKKQERLAENK